MIDGLRPYSEMKPSGLAWLGDVPAHWDVRRAKHVFREVDRRSIAGEELHLSMSQRLGLVPANLVDKSLVSESYIGGKLVEKDDLVLNRLKAHLGVFACAKQPGLISPDYTVLRAIAQIDIRFFEFVFKSSACRIELRTRAKGIVEGFWRLYTDDLYDIRVPFPPLEEQRLVVRFLDWHGAQTAKLIRAKKRLIALLNEQKQAIIHRAVTRGLDPDVELKPSGIPWIGDMPIGWETTRIKNIARLQSGESITAFEIEEIGPFPVFGGNGLRGYTSRFTHDGNYVLIGRQGALCGNINYASGQFFASEHAVVVHPRTKLSTRWLGELLRIMNLNQYSIAAAQPGLSVERISNLQIPLPAPQEQERIIQAVDHEICGLDRSIGYVGREQALVQEFRARLIADVVTGKLDVRAAAASLPETTDFEINDQTIEPDEFAETDDLENEEAAA